jgi:hypothetical protein
MIASSHQRLSLDDVLAEIAALPAPPNAQELRGLMGKYPEFKASIIEFVTDWIEMEASKVPHHVTTEEVDLVVNRTMSRVQQLLDAEQRPGPIADLAADITAAGYDLASFQRAVGIDLSILTCVAERKVRPASMPLRLIADMATALRRNIEHVRNYVRLPPELATAHKARKQPQLAQVDFAFLVEHADLPRSDKVRWLAEAPDPALQD